jgi:uncharacterized membrane protein
MSEGRTKHEINDGEWRNPDNWRGIVYFGKQDSRIIVPLSWSDGYFGPYTINLGHRWGWLWLAVIASTALAMIAVPTLL